MSLANDPATPTAPPSRPAPALKLWDVPRVVSKPSPANPAICPRRIGKFGQALSEHLLARSRARRELVGPPVLGGDPAVVNNQTTMVGRRLAKALLFPLLTLIVGCAPQRQSDAAAEPIEGVQTGAPQGSAGDSRREQLLLEGLINDYCYRHNVRNDFEHARCYANVSLEDIIVYIYPVTGSPPVLVTLEQELLAEQLPKHIREQFLSFPEWEWAKDYTITVVDRTK